MPESGPSNPPQFGTAEYIGAPGADHCKLCNQPITGTYYRAHTTILCGSCAERVRRETPKDSHAAFTRALVFGVGGFAAGLILYAGFVILTGISIGYVALAVGWIVGKAMMLGSKGIGGRRYQVVAVLLTYAAVSMAFVPIVIHYANKERTRTSQQAQQPAVQSPQDSQANPTPEPPPGQGSAEQARPKRDWASIIGKLALIGLASPFLELQSGFSGLIGLVILFVGMQFAWRMTAGHPKIVVDGPFQTSPSARA
jgi:hypothetical protein